MKKTLIKKKKIPKYLCDLLFSFMEWERWRSRGWKKRWREGEREGGRYSSNMEHPFGAISSLFPLVSFQSSLWLLANCLNFLQLFPHMQNGDKNACVIGCCDKCDNVPRACNSVSSTYYPLTVGIYRMLFVSKAC